MRRNEFRAGPLGSTLMRAAIIHGIVVGSPTIAGARTVGFEASDGFSVGAVDLDGFGSADGGLTARIVDDESEHGRVVSLENSGGAGRLRIPVVHSEDGERILSFEFAGSGIGGERVLVGALSIDLESGAVGSRWRRLDIDRATAEGYLVRLDGQVYGALPHISLTDIELHPVNGAIRVDNFTLDELREDERPPSSGVYREVWFGVSGAGLENLLKHPEFPAAPDYSDVMPSFEGPSNWANSYGSRFRALLTPTVSGVYQFWISGDDHSELWLSSDASPASRELIASVPSWTQSREWTRFPEQGSEGMELVAGETYYIEALSKEGWGGDNLAVGWMGPGIEEIEIIEGEFLAPYREGVAYPGNPRFVINAGPDFEIFLPRRDFDLKGNMVNLGALLPDAPISWYSAGTRGAAIESPNALETRVSVPGPGEYFFDLNIGDSDWGFWDSVKVTVGGQLFSGRGGVTREAWLNLGGNQVERLRNDARFPSSPDIVDTTSSFEGPTDWSNRFGVRARAYVYPPEDGFHTFWITGNDDVELYLSSSASPEDRELIASTEGGTRYQQIHRRESQRSEPIFLNSGTRYYIELLQKDNWGEDHYSVFWQCPSDPAPRLLTEEYLEPYFDAPRFDSTLDLMADAGEDRTLYLPKNRTLLDGDISYLRLKPEAPEFRWRLLDGPGKATIYRETASETDIEVTTPGVYIFEFEAREGGRQATDTVKVDVLPGLGNDIGGLTREVFLNVKGNRLSALLEDGLIDRMTPDIVDVIPAFETPANWMDLYGTRVRGYIVAPETGDYEFWIAGDDQSELLLSGNDDPLGANLIAQVSSHTGWRQWDRRDEQYAAGIRLEKGQRYYVEALSKEGWGRDHLSVAWRGPGIPTREVIHGAYLVPFEKAKPHAGALEILLADVDPLYLPQNSCELSAVVYDLVDGPKEISVEWSTPNAPGFARFSAPQSLNTSVTFKSAGDYTVRLTATDGENTRWAEMTVSLRAPLASGVGAITRDVWFGIKGSALSELTEDYRFPDHPFLRTVANELRTPVNWANNYGTRLHGYIHPPMTGDYTFWLAGDDESALWLSSSEAPGDKVRIAHVPSYSSPGQWNRYESQQSQPIRLKGGEKYYIEVLQKEGWGGDHVSVAWEGPGIRERAIVDGAFLSPEVDARALSANQKLFVHAGMDQTIYWPSDALELAGEVVYSQSEEGRVPSFQWRWVSGPGPVVFEDANALRTRARFPREGEYVLELTGQDGVDRHGDRVSVRVAPALAANTGALLREVFMGVNGRMVSHLVESDRFPNSPTFRDEMPGFEAPSNWANNYGARYRGYLHVPEAGDYEFFISSDDYSELYLSASESPKDSKPIAYVDSWNRVKDWHRKPYQRSGSMRLEPGRRYYIEAIYKEQGGNDHFAVGWTGPGMPEIQAIDRGFLEPFEPASNFSEHIQVLTHGEGRTLWPRNTVRVSGIAFDLVKGPDPLTYQWSLVDGVSASFDNPGAQSTEVTFEKPGDYTLRFSVSDGAHTEFEDLRVSVSAPTGSGLTGMSREVWLGVRGRTLDNLRNHDAFPDAPSFKDLVTDAATPRDWANNYGSRIRGYLYPPETGTYYLWLSGDDYSELNFSTDENPENAERIAYIDGWSHYLEWDRYPSQRSGALELVGGRKYYIEALMNERWGADHLEIGWSRAEDAMPSIIPGGYLSPFETGNYVDEEILLVAGRDLEITWPERLVTMDGYARDLRPGPYELLVGWRAPDGVLLTRDNSAETLAVFPGPGDYTLELVGDDGANTRSDSITVRVLPPMTETSGFVIREIYEEIEGSGLSRLLDASKFPEAPDSRTVLNRLKGPVNVLNNYGTRIRGFIHPPESGTYTFWIAGDDQSHFSLSTDETPENASLIAHVPNWSQSREWEKFPEQRSEEVSLNGGGSYFFEVLHKEGWGGDNIAVAWSGPGIDGRQVIDGAYLSRFRVEGDDEGPEIQLHGLRTMSIAVGDTWVEPGFSTQDNVDGDLTDQTSVLGDVDTMRPGVYTIVYLAHDSSGNRAPLTYREVRVERLPSSGVSASWPTSVPEDFVPPAPSGWRLPESVTESDAARFLTQATFGATERSIESVRELGLQRWIDKQQSLPASLHFPHLEASMRLLGSGFYDREMDMMIMSDDMGRTPKVNDRSYTWWTHAIEAPDQLRQRVAFALSEILVVSDRSPALRRHTFGMANYYDIMVRNAFGNYRDIMEEVSLSPIMGVYLTSLRNTKADPETGSMPDENYARELLQLFTIGLHWLYPDGTPMLDGSGERIATYGMDEILSFARVFTGWTINGSDNFFWIRNRDLDMLSPMMAFEEWHDTEAKTLLGGVTLPAHQTAYQDLSDALDNIFYHPNMGPFIARGLIQRLVTSNPTPGYIYRVAQVFDDNGSGVRGDLGAVVRAILLDEEARNPAIIDRDSFGKQKEPILRLSHLIRAFYEFQTDNPPTLGRFGIGTGINGPLGQAPMYAPSVFNFFDPDYSPTETLRALGLVAPEFQITSEATAIDGANFFHSGVDRGFRTRSGFVERVNLNLARAIEEASSVDGLLDYLDSVLMSGQMSAEFRRVLYGTLSDLDADSVYRAKSAIQLIMTSPDYVIQR